MSARGTQPDGASLTTGFKDIPGTNVVRKVDVSASLDDASLSAAASSATKATNARSSATEYQDIPGTNIPRKTQLAEVVDPASLALGGSSAGGGFADIPGTNVPRRVPLPHSGDASVGK